MVDIEKVIIGGATLFCGDCLPAMVAMSNNAFDLAIVDPPYGIGDKFKGGSSGKIQFNEVVEKGWDVVPSAQYFVELFRVSRDQIIWGGNYFDLPPCKKPLCWDKVRPNQKAVSEWEYAWTSFDGRAQKFEHCANGGFLLAEPRVHPTQKPIKLYSWLLQNFAKEGHAILDTHLGSGSSVIACLERGFNVTAFEIDREYFDAACERIHRAQQQLKLF